MSTDLILRTEIDYRQARTREAYRSSRKVNRVRRPKTPSERVA